MQTSSSSYWNGLGSSLTQLGLDWARAKFVDVETRTDDRNIPDDADLRYSGAGDERGIKVSTVVTVVAVIAAVTVVAVVALKR